MKKFVNNPKNYVNDVLEGVFAAHGHRFRAIGGNKKCIAAANTRSGCVSLITGGGSGHLPLFLGYVGEGMLDACAVGDIFTAPDPDEILLLVQAVENQNGVIFIIGNYNGDKASFKMASEVASLEHGIKNDIVIVNDDVATGLPQSAASPDIRRGISGLFFVYKCTGAAATEALPFEDVLRVAKKCAAHTRSLGVALSPCTVPRIGTPSFHLAENEIQLGIGLHGEPGILRRDISASDNLVEEMMERILSDIDVKDDSEVAVVVNGLGGTPLEEEYIVFGRVAGFLSEKGVKIHRSYIGEYATSLDMAGVSISVLLLDEELKHYLEMPAYTPFFKETGRE
jgi:dihydroxyacetone kinase-like protein